MKATALLVGLGEVYDARVNTWASLPFTKGNILKIGEYLANSSVTNILLENKASKANIVEMMSVIEKSAFDKVILYYSGHSSKSKVGSIENTTTSEFIVSYDNYIANTDTEFLQDTTLTNAIKGLLSAGKKVICIMETCYAEGLIDIGKFTESLLENLVIFSSSTKNNPTYFLYGLNSFFFMAVEKIITNSPHISFSNFKSRLNEEINLYKSKYPSLDLQTYSHLGNKLLNETFI